MTDPHDMDDAALGWAVRVADPDFADWEGFTAWLEQNPRHAEAYDRISARVAEAAAVLPFAPPVAAPEVLPVPRRSRRWVIGGALAASLAAVAGIGVERTRPDPYMVEVAAGATRTVPLDDGSRIEVAGGTRLVLDRRNPRSVALEQGQAMFFVHHDAAAPFRVRLGEDELLDVGTAFDV
jgi:transmembrane sensor